MPFSLRTSASKIGTRIGKTTIVTVVTQQQVRKTVRFRVPLLNNDEEASMALALVEDVNQYHNQESMRRMRRHQDRFGAEEEGKCTEADGDAYNSWYTATELRSFRSNISLTIINWMLLHDDLVSTDPADERDERRSTPTTSTSNDDTSSSSSNSNSRIGNNSNSHRNSITTIREHRHRLFTTMVTQKYNNYTYCLRGVEGRTPLEKASKSKRRKEALQSVFSFQQKRRRKQQHDAATAQVVPDHQEQQQQQHQQWKPPSSSYQQRKEQKQVEVDDHDRNVQALAKLYASYCIESCTLAMERGKTDSMNSSITVVDETTAATTAATTTATATAVENKSCTDVVKRQIMNKEKMMTTTNQQQPPAVVLSSHTNKSVVQYQYHHHYHSLCDDICDENNNNHNHNYNDDDSDLFTAFFCGGYTLVPFFYKNILSRIYIDY